VHQGKCKPAGGGEERSPRRTRRGTEEERKGLGIGDWALGPETCDGGVVEGGVGKYEKRESGKAGKRKWRGLWVGALGACCGA
jgi:hypothetical protein